MFSATIRTSPSHRSPELPVLSAVLFDLDGTLLDIDIDAFLRVYFAQLGPAVADLLGGLHDARTALDAVLDATRAMGDPHPDITNQQAFDARFEELTGHALRNKESAAFLTRFYEQVFPTLRGEIGPHAGARECVEAALELGLKVAIATNPIFPKAAIEERICWAGVSDLPVDVVTTYENMHATKPHAAYFFEVAEKLGVAPNDALMVGDDRFLDLPAADVGMRTFFVGSGPAPGADWTGTLCDLAELLPRIS
jgi:FMN phosphatase YigB (HAD superfamily)